MELPNQTSYVAENDESSYKQEEKTLKEKLADVYHLEVEEIEKPTFLFKDILTKILKKLLLGIVGRLGETQQNLSNFLFFLLKPSVNVEEPTRHFITKNRV